MGFVYSRSRSRQDNTIPDTQSVQHSTSMASAYRPQRESYTRIARRSRWIRYDARSEENQVTDGAVIDSVLDIIDKAPLLPAEVIESPTTTEVPRLSTRSYRRDDDNDQPTNGPPRGGGPPINQDREHLLIAAGAIGAFILFCFIGWVVYRLLKKSGKLGGERGVPFEASPYARYTQYPPSEPPSMYDKADLMYGPDNKIYSRTASAAARSSYAYSGGGTLRRQPPGMPLSNQYMMAREEPPQTADDRAIEQYYDELFAAQPRNSTRGPAQRGNRVSDVSSLSSGFGDGEFIVAQPLATPPRAAAPSGTASAKRESEAYERPSSWASQAERRETIYTTTSEDRPARFRTLSSWVNQQSGRVKRADSRAQERGEVPVMPAVPGEMSFIRQTAYR